MRGTLAPMARGGAVALTAATATKIADNPLSDSLAYVVVNNGTGGTLYLGGANVSNTVNGDTIAAAARQIYTLAPEDELWAYSVAGSASGLTVLTSP